MSPAPKRAPAPPVDPPPIDFERQVAERLATALRLDAEDAEARRAHADDLAWVTRDRDVLLAALDGMAEAIMGLQRANPEEREGRIALFRRQAIEAGELAVRRREAAKKGDG